MDKTFNIFHILISSSLIYYRDVITFLVCPGKIIYYAKRVFSKISSQLEKIYIRLAGKTTIHKRLNKKQINTSLYLNFFTNRIINLWNSLPQEVVNVDTLNQLKIKIDSRI